MNRPKFCLFVFLLALKPSISQGADDDPQELLKEATAAFKEGNLSKAKNLLTRACGFKHQASCDYSWGSIYEKEGDVKNAQKFYSLYLANQQLDSSPNRAKRINWAQDYLKKVATPRKPNDARSTAGEPGKKSGAVLRPRTVLHPSGSPTSDKPKWPDGARPATCETCPRADCPTAAPQPPPTPPSTALSILKIKNDVPGALIQNLTSYPKGLTIGAGVTEIIEPIGEKTLIASVPDVKNIEIKVNLEVGKITEKELSWNNKFVSFNELFQDPKKWNKFLHSRYTPSSFISPPKLWISFMSAGFIAGIGSAIGFSLCATMCQDRVLGQVIIGSVGVTALGWGVAGAAKAFENRSFRTIKPGLDADGRRAQQRYW